VSGENNRENDLPECKHHLIKGGEQKRECKSHLIFIPRTEEKAEGKGKNTVKTHPQQNLKCRQKTGGVEKEKCW